MLESVGNDIKIGLEDWTECIWTVVIGLRLRASGGLCRREDKTLGSQYAANFSSWTYRNFWRKIFAVLTLLGLSISPNCQQIAAKRVTL